MIGKRASFFYTKPIEERKNNLMLDNRIITKRAKPYLQTRSSKKMSLRSGAFYDTFKPQALPFYTCSVDPISGGGSDICHLQVYLRRRKDKAPSAFIVAGEGQLGFTADSCFATPVTKFFEDNLAEPQSPEDKLSTTRLPTKAYKCKTSYSRFQSDNKLGLMKPNGIRKARQIRKKNVSFKVSRKPAIL